eukprot:755133-Hanusia_phi.AAC.2
MGVKQDQQEGKVGGHKEAVKGGAGAMATYKVGKLVRGKRSAGGRQAGREGGKMEEGGREGGR